MHAHIKIGDCTVSIVEASVDIEDSRHVITVSDAWTSATQEIADHEAVCMSRVVDSETDAIIVLQDFLRIDGPTGPFRQMFPHHSP